MYACGIISADSLHKVSCSPVRMRALDAQKINTDCCTDTLRYVTRCATPTAAVAAAWKVTRRRSRSQHPCNTDGRTARCAFGLLPPASRCLCACAEAAPESVFGMIY